MNAFSMVLGAIVLFLLAVGALSFMAMVKGCFFLRRLARTTPRYDGNILLKSPLVAPVSVIMAVADASDESRALAQRLVELHYSKGELVLVLDGPDETELYAWIKEFRLCLSARGPAEDLKAAPIRGIYESRDPLRLVVVDKEPGGQADALNVGINLAASPVIGLFDPECEFEPTILLSLIRPMLDDPGRTVAVCGVMPAQEEFSGPDPESSKGRKADSVWAARFGTLETLRLWLARCAGFAAWNLLVPVPGVSMLVLRDAIVKLGGFTAGPLEMFLHLHGHARASGAQYRVAFVPEAVSHARVARSFADLRKRNENEDRAIARALGHRKKIDGGIRATGWGLPGLFCVRFFRPLLETAAYPMAAVGLAMGWIEPELGGLVLLSTVGMGILVSLSAVVLRELAEFGASDPGRLAGLFVAAIGENLGYRQLRNLWLIAGFFSRK